MYIYIYLLPLRLLFYLVVPYVHVLGLVLAHVAVITLSDAPIAGYNLTFLAGNFHYHYHWYLFIICCYLGQVISWFPINTATIIIILFIYL